MSAVTDVPEAFLVLPKQGDRTITALNAKVRAIALRRLLRHPTAGMERSLRRVLLDTRRVLAAVGSANKAVLMEAIGHPDVLTPLLVAELGLEDYEPAGLIGQALPPLMAGLAQLAPKGTVPEALIHDLPLDHLADAWGHRRFTFDPPARGVLLDPLGLEINLADETKVRLARGASMPAEAAGMTLDRPFHPLRQDLPRLELSLYDSNPLSMYEAHPDKEGNAISLGEKSLQDWLDAFGEALDMVKATLPAWYTELRSSMRRLVPVGYLPERHLSASYREAPGVAYLTLCEDPMTIAEAIIHETQHTKVNLLSWVDPIVHNAHTCWTESPVRPDLRPLWGVLLAVHAFVPVSMMHKRLADMGHPCTEGPRFPRRRHEVLVANRRGMDAVLGNADPSGPGRRLIEEMDAVLRMLEEAAPPPPPGLELDPHLLPPS